MFEYTIENQSTNNKGLSDAKAVKSVDEEFRERISNQTNAIFAVMHGECIEIEENIVNAGTQVINKEQISFLERSHERKLLAMQQSQVYYT